MKSDHMQLGLRVETLNIMLERPVCTPGVGHLALDISTAGLQLFEIVNEVGARRDWSGILSSAEMKCFIDGVVSGFALRNEQLGQKLLKLQQESAATTAEKLHCSDLDVTARVTLSNTEQAVVAACDHTFEFYCVTLHNSSDVYRCTKCGEYKTVRHGDEL